MPVRSFDRLRDAAAVAPCPGERQTWALHCRGCNREVAVDVIKLVEGVADVRDFNSTATFARAKCRECGSRMKLTGRLPALKPEA